MRITLAAAPDAATVEAEAASRRITGMLLPFGVVTTPMVGPRVEFAADGKHSTAGADVWLNREHADSEVLGRAVSIESREDGVHASFEVLGTQAGNDALVEAAAGARSGLSVEAEIVAHQDAGDHIVVTESLIVGAALVRRPAFPEAGVYDVAATAATDNPTEEVEQVEQVPAVTEAAPEVAAAAPALVIAERPRPMPTLAEYIIAAGQKDAARLHDFNRRIQAAAPDTQVGDIDGLIPVPLLSEVINLRDAMAPVFNALGPNTAPEGKAFRIPKITTNIAAAAAAAEGTDMTAQLVVGDIDVTMAMLKRAANISYEAIQYSQPGVVSVATGDLADALLVGIEDYTTTAIEAITGTNTPVVVAADGSDAWSVLAGAISTFYGAVGRRPDVFACPPDVWAALAGMTNSLGQPLINGVTQNLAGSWGTLFGLPVVVSYEFTAGEGYLLSTYGIRSWASSGISAQLTQPNTFEYQLGVARSIGVSVADGKFVTPVTVGP